ncbi:hypothetical protein [Nonomuraea longicatena]|uniref:Secreted protein n=1 Tax=Nonomuraea longicatena TaxID=83682 RepID=A0ABP3ZRP2_9ACTN
MRIITIMITIGVLGLPMATTAHAEAGTSVASPDDCDGNGVMGRFRAVGSGASFDYRGRRVELQNESIFDRYSRAEIKSGRQSGDRVWVDRSHRRFPADRKGIIGRTEAEARGWKQCGPFTWRTQSVFNNYYAARACARIGGTSKCGKWYLD